MDEKELFGAIESVLYVSGEPLSFFDLQNVFEISKEDLTETLDKMDSEMHSAGRGVRLFMTDETVQLVTNPVYNDWIVKLLEPPEERTLSNSMLETLSFIAYRQPVTRMDIEAVRGVRCEYSVSQLLRQGFIKELGRKDCVGHPVLFGTTDAFLRRFGLHSLDELPKLPETPEERNELLETVQSAENASGNTAESSGAAGTASEAESTGEVFEQLNIEDEIKKQDKAAEKCGAETGRNTPESMESLPKSC